MKPTPIFVAAAGFAMLGACSVTTSDDENAAGSPESNSAVAAGETATPAQEAAGETDTLGNQLNQLNESRPTDNEAENSAVSNSAS